MASKRASQREIEAAVSEILWREWDPIGINSESAARSEYDTYVPQIVSALMRGQPTEAIAHKLRSIAAQQMQIDFSGSMHRLAAEKCVEAWKLHNLSQ
jgi:hypothetical protein